MMTSQVLSASHKYYKLACDVSELTSRIERKIEQVPQVVGGDYVSVEDHKRKHEMFTQDVKAISFQVSFRPLSSSKISDNLFCRSRPFVKLVGN